MRGHPAVASEDRRIDARLPGAGAVDVFLLDASADAPVPLPPAQVLNLSATGVALLTLLRVRPGSYLELRLPAERSSRASMCRLEVLDCTAWTRPHYLLRCQVLHGHLPARLFFDPGLAASAGGVR